MVVRLVRVMLWLFDFSESKLTNVPLKTVSDSGHEPSQTASNSEHVPFENERKLVTRGVNFGQHSSADS